MEPTSGSWSRRLRHGCRGCRFTSDARAELTASSASSSNTGAGERAYDVAVMPRRFRLRIRPGRMVGTFISSSDDTPMSARAGEEVVVSEDAAAGLLRLRAAELIDIVESEEDGRDPH